MKSRRIRNFHKMTKGFLFVIALLVFLAVFSARSSAVSGEIITVDITATFKQSEARSMLSIINNWRADSANNWYYDTNNVKKYKGSLSGLTYDYKLEAYAMQRAMEIAYAYYYYNPVNGLNYPHVHPNGLTIDKGFPDMYEVEGRTYTRDYTKIGENIACGENAVYNTAQKVFTAWQETDLDYNGQGHRRNMLGGDDYLFGGSNGFNRIGIACVYYKGSYFWVQEFGYSTKALADSTTANNSTETYTIEVDDANILAAELYTPTETIALSNGESANLPSIEGKLSVRGAFIEGTAYDRNGNLYMKQSGTAYITVNPSWSVKSGSNVVRIDSKNKTITAIANGTAVITATVRFNGGVYTKDIAVNVIHEFSGDSARVVETVVYDGTPKTPIPSVVVGGKLLQYGVDYTVEYSNNVNAGTASFTVIGMGGFSGTIPGTFMIEQAEPVLRLSEFPTELTVGESIAIDILELKNDTNAVGFRWVGEMTLVSDPKVDGRVILTPLAAGTIDFTVYSDGTQNYGDIKLDYTFTVNKAAPELTLSSYSASFTKSATASFKIDTDSNGEIVVSSSDESVARPVFDREAGVVTVVGEKPGDAVITVELLESSVFAGATATFNVTVLADPVNIYYTTFGSDNHAKRYTGNGNEAGMEGEAITGIEARIPGHDNLGVRYRTYDGNEWEVYGGYDGIRSGSTGIQALQMSLTGSEADDYDIWYSVYAANTGWLGWACNDEKTGTAGCGLEIEKIRILVVAKGTELPDWIEDREEAEVFIDATNLTPEIVYSVYGSGLSGNLPGEFTAADGETAGVTGVYTVYGIGLQIKNSPYTGSVVYSVCTDKAGWLENAYDGSMAGINDGFSAGAVKISLDGDISLHYSICYRVFAGGGWSEWAADGDVAGSPENGEEIEALCVILREKE